MQALQGYQTEFAPLKLLEPNNSEATMAVSGSIEEGLRVRLRVRLRNVRIIQVMQQDGQLTPKQLIS